MSVDLDINNLRSLVSSAEGAAHAIITIYPAGTDASKNAIIILNAMITASGALDSLIGDLASQNAGANASGHASLAACQQQIATLTQQLASAQASLASAQASARAGSSDGAAIQQPASGAAVATPSGVSTGAAVTMTLGGSIIGGIIGWAARGRMKKG